MASMLPQRRQQRLRSGLRFIDRYQAPGPKGSLRPSFPPKSSGLREPHLLVRDLRIWHIASIRGNAALGRFRSEADID